VLDREDVEEHPHAPQTSRTLLGVGMGEFHLEKLRHFMKQQLDHRMHLAN